MNNRQEKTTVNEGTFDQEFAVGNSDRGQTAIEKVVNVKTSEECFHERIDTKIGNIVDTVEDQVQNVISAAMDRIFTPKVDLAIRSINASSERDSTSVMGNSERGKHRGVTAPLENVSERDNTLHVKHINDETRNIIQDKLSELSIPDTYLERQPQTHHIMTGQTIQAN